MKCLVTHCSADSLVNLRWPQLIALRTSRIACQLSHQAASNLHSQVMANSLELKQPQTIPCSQPSACCQVRMVLNLRNHLIPWAVISHRRKVRTHCWTTCSPASKRYCQRVPFTTMQHNNHHSIPRLHKSCRCLLQPKEHMPCPLHTALQAEHRPVSARQILCAACTNLTQCTCHPSNLCSCCRKQTSKAPL